MCCHCRLQPRTGGRSNQSPWTSGIKGAAATSLRDREHRKGKNTDGGEREKSGRSRSVEERRRAADTATAKEPGCEQRREPDGKCPGGIRNTDSGTGGAARSFQPRFRRSVAHPGASIEWLREKQGWLGGGA
ncbi:hypothetical protein NDU88_003999 [Pleurodeles waltl]|uniref:Uncharacterized protein n=1 Tax=Pleurodeles waltl TaxID=8319 RepID=A0AAV7NL06_PLEWA|nr:hypothetical protein NDU88_003999 [Pleurodeles waltl]